MRLESLLNNFLADSIKSHAQVDTDGNFNEFNNFAIYNLFFSERKKFSKHLDRWGSSLAIETFASFDIWAEQSASTSLMSNGDGRQT